MSDDRFDFELDHEVGFGAVTSHHGVPVFLEYFRTSGATSIVDREVSFKRRKRGLSSSQMVESFLALWACGGEPCEDLEPLRGGDGLAFLLGHDLPAPQTAREFLAGFEEPDLPLLGGGKSWLACALGQKACREGSSVLYKRGSRIFAELELGRGDGRYPRMFRALVRANLLILDDWGPETLSPDHRRDFLEIFENRYGIGSVLITSHLPLDQWHQVIGDPTLADAILDRLVPNAYRLELDGESMRKRLAQKHGAET